MDPAATLKVTGRVKEMIIRGGENLFPAEIETCSWSTRIIARWPW